ncbi:hypothetical protein MUK42_35017 [Musa troglodytarum]|uniref:Uncharacterized protein n=1 Tax=Musa troglodytarum TaxID=320322 RepID=A0A9E7JSJ7_9LILI|nr:hypothetical protein MUK42_35017 [Musa troglodytarum]
MCESSERNPPSCIDPPNLSTDAFSFIHCRMNNKVEK